MEIDHAHVGVETAAVENAERRNGGNEEFRFRECTKNQAFAIGGQAFDGCGEFMPGGQEGTLEALSCAACNCHRNFHRRELVVQNQHQTPIHHYQTIQREYIYNQRRAGYLHTTASPSAHHQPQLAQPSASRNDLEAITIPTSIGGGGGSSGGGGGDGSRKRFRTKFTQDQKDRMLVFAEALGWRIQKDNESAVQQFCVEIGINRKVLKVWMHNNKHTLGKKP